MQSILYRCKIGFFTAVTLSTTAYTSFSKLLNITAFDLAITRLLHHTLSQPQHLNFYAHHTHLQTNQPPESPIHPRKRRRAQSPGSVPTRRQTCESRQPRNWPLTQWARSRNSVSREPIKRSLFRGCIYANAIKPPLSRRLAKTRERAREARTHARRGYSCT